METLEDTKILFSEGYIFEISDIFSVHLIPKTKKALMNLQVQVCSLVQFITTSILQESQQTLSEVKNSIQNILETVGRILTSPRRVQGPSPGKCYKEFDQKSCS